MRVAKTPKGVPLPLAVLQQNSDRENNIWKYIYMHHILREICCRGEKEKVKKLLCHPVWHIKKKQFFVLYSRRPSADEDENVAPWHLFVLRADGWVGWMDGAFCIIGHYPTRAVHAADAPSLLSCIIYFLKLNTLFIRPGANLTRAARTWAKMMCDAKAHTGTSWLLKSFCM